MHKEAGAELWARCALVDVAESRDLPGCRYRLCATSSVFLPRLSSSWTRKDLSGHSAVSYGSTSDMSHVDTRKLKENGSHAGKRRSHYLDKTASRIPFANQQDPRIQWRHTDGASFAATGMLCVRWIPPVSALWPLATVATTSFPGSFISRAWEQGCRCQFHSQAQKVRSPNLLERNL